MVHSKTNLLYVLRWCFSQHADLETGRPSTVEWSTYGVFKLRQPFSNILVVNEKTMITILFLWGRPGIWFHFPVVTCFQILGVTPDVDWILSFRKKGWSFLKLSLVSFCSSNLTLTTIWRFRRALEINFRECRVASQLKICLDLWMINHKQDGDLPLHMAFWHPRQTLYYNICRNYGDPFTKIKKVKSVVYRFSNVQTVVLMAFISV